MLDAALSYPAAVAQNLTPGPQDSEVTVSVIAGPDLAATENTLNSFLNCCLDVSRVGRFLVVDTGLSRQDRAALLERYHFLEFSPSAPPNEPGALLAHIRDQIGGRYWLHLGHGWRFFAPERLITRLTSVLAAEPDVVQVAINYGDAATLTGACAPDDCRVANARRRSVPADRRRRQRPGDVRHRTAGSGDAASRSASLDEVLCVAAV